MYTNSASTKEYYPVSTMYPSPSQGWGILYFLEVFSETAREAVVNTFSPAPFMREALSLSPYI